MIDYAKSFNVPLNFNLFKPFKKEQKPLTLKPSQYFKFIENIFRQKRLYGLNIGLTNAAIAGELTNHKKRETCRATLSGLSINVEGGMVPCPFLEEVGYYKTEKLPKFDEKFLNTWKSNCFLRNSVKEICMNVRLVHIYSEVTLKQKILMELGLF